MRKIIERLVLMLFGLLIALIFSEIALRIIFPLPQRPVNIYKTNPLRGSELRPNIEYSAFNDVLEFNTKVKINSWGFRDDNIDFFKTDKKVILALGDSYTYAHEVERERTFVEILQRKLTSVLEQDIEIINAGIRGYGTAQEFLYYKELAEKGLKADLVLLFLVTNDVTDNLCLDPNMKRIRPCYQIVDNTLKLDHLPEVPRRSVRAKASDGKRPVGSKVAKRKNWSKFYKDSRLYNLTYVKLRHLGMNYPKVISLLNSFGFKLKPVRIPSTIQGWNTEKSSYGWRLTEKIIMELNNEVRKDGGQLVVVFIPHSIQYSQKKQKIIKSTLKAPGVDEFLKDPKKPQRLVTTFDNVNDIHVIDILPGLEFALAQHKGEGSPFDFPFDGHLNPAGHVLIANIVYKHIMENTRILDFLKRE
jgi:lysophospholipase L1-like esterase